MAKKKKAAAPRGNTWVGYYPRVTKDKTKYSRKEKHKKDYRRDSGSLFLLRWNAGRAKACALFKKGAPPALIFYNPALASPFPLFISAPQALFSFLFPRRRPFSRLDWAEFCTK